MTKAAEYSARWRERHPEKVAAQRQRRRETGYSKEWARANPEAAWANRLQHFHKMTPGDYEALWEKQRGCCYLCGESLIRGKVHIEHDHACCPEGRSCVLCRRGLACRGCNWILAWCQEDPAKLRRIADVLESLPR